MKKIYLLLLSLLMVNALYAQQTLIYCGNLIDGKSDKVQQEMTILVVDEEIVEVKKGYAKPASGDQIIDLKDKTVLPGLMDMHVHLEGEASPTSYIDEFKLNEADIAFNATVYAKLTLMAGFTTVRDLGGSGVNTALRDAINSGKVIGPRIYSAGKSIATTGGHADPTNSYRHDLMGDPGPHDGVINGPYEARKAVRQRYKNGADVIKITATGGVLSVAKDGSGPQFQMDELEAIVQTANEYGMITAAHAHGAEGMKRAVQAGITSIEHGTLMTPEIMDLMKEKGTYYVPTISAGKFVAEKAKIEGFYPALVVPKALAIGPKIQSTFAEAYKRGVNIVFGTDAGVFPHGDNGKEFGYMVEVGMPPMKAIQAATIIPAQMLRIDQKYGSIEKGKMADIIAVNENPLENIHTMEEVVFVMKGGEVLKR
ncbi:metal-dependent hydrolase family protein [Fulvivirga sediminis]|uniref:Amidohydrolase family protein n=1 Tax=Fulvivirga sediminis TaxID=2803949 RepID=A0A937F8R6_9BACT|nr:amidohydrolase family protein [Fulvivirga sediminis]MBL3656058.1 amidohydrolase family protein [Fulvivirga sediminis]